ncbi:MAG: ribosome maturation factor RimM [Xanthomonadaceae bacterium]|nr:ribosome maturation factor RimM [Xanthomonadaceae bacterium]MDE1961030.1 ribosome maturation factor RimM [Xanthomonadaceae bacterium]MDE2085259.1 ribosome maturation factor RimM [Xanthomonadaceae bacterium]MDE2257108.1 ribosome maturation factor RimM [Xanthomonadaceae bacterium]
MSTDRLLTVGKVVGLYGVDGWLKIESYTEPRLRIFAYRPWRLTLAGSETEVPSAQGHEQGKGIVAKLPGCDDRDAAAKLIGTAIHVPRSALPKPGRGEYYWTDLEGLDVVTVDRVALGKVSHLFATGANDVLVVRDGIRERLIPFVTGQFVKAVDLKEGRITVDWDPEF